MAKTRKVSKTKIIRFAILILIGLFVLIGVYFLLNHKSDKKATEVKTVDQIEGYSYQLDENETKYYKDTFAELKSILTKDNVEENEYVSLVARLFLTDFFNLDNKTSNNDIGGTQYVYRDYQSDFEKYAKDPQKGIYAYVESNIYGNRKQELPVVTKVDVVSVDAINHTYKGKTDSKAYKVKASITYKKDLGYQEEATLIFVHNGKKLEIVKMS